MKRGLIAVMAVCMSVLAASAKSLVFTLDDGSKVYYLLGGDTNPVMRFVDGGVTVNADNYTFSKIKSFNISDTDDPNGIEKVISGKGMSLSGDVLVLNAGNSEDVRVYNASGAQVNADVTVSDGRAFVSLKDLGKGVYLVKVNGSSIKVQKK